MARRRVPVLTSTDDTVTRGRLCENRVQGALSGLRSEVKAATPIDSCFASTVDSKTSGQAEKAKIGDRLKYVGEYLFNMLLYYSRVRMQRKTISDVGKISQRSIPLIVLVVTICAACVITYVAVLAADQWAAPKELRLLVVGAILGIGLFIRGIGVHR